MCSLEQYLYRQKSSEDYQRNPLRNARGVGENGGGVHAPTALDAMVGRMRTPKFILTDPELFSLLLLEKNRQAGVQLLLNSYCTDLVMEGSSIKAIVLENKQGTLAVKTKIVIDSSGEGDIAAKSGVPFITDPNHGAISNTAGLLVRFGNVDMDVFFQAFMDLPEEANPGFTSWLAGHLGKTPEELQGDSYWKRFLDPLGAHGMPRTWGDDASAPHFGSEVKRWFKDRWDRDGFFAYISMWLFREYMQKAAQNGDFDFNRAIDGVGEIVFNFDGFSAGKYRKGEMVLNAVTPANGIDFFDTEQITSIEIASRKRVYELWRFFKKYIPGFESSYIEDTGVQTMSRHPRIVESEYLLTREDLQKSQSFDDVIFINAYEPTPGIAHEVPYRIMVPKGMSNLLVAGKASAGAICVRPVPGIMALGQAAGTAAALAVQRNETVGDLNISALQAELRKQDVILDMDNREQLG